MALAEFFTTAARARIVGPHWRLFCHLFLFLREDVHHLIGVTSAAQKVCHDAHRFVDVIEEFLIASA